MKSITRQKPFEAIQEQLSGLERLFLVGCGTCTTTMKTGGIEQVLEMKTRLQDADKWVSGFAVIPTACDQMTELTMKEHQAEIDASVCLLAMTCALGVHRLNLYTGKPVIPALDTLFIGVEEEPGGFYEACGQCGQCVLGETAGICPVVGCHKGLLNGPCGGTNKGKCEVDSQRDCAWTLIYEGLKVQGRLPLMKKYQPPRDYQVMPRPRVVQVP